MTMSETDWTFQGVCYHQWAIRLIADNCGQNAEKWGDDTLRSEIEILIDQLWKRVSRAEDAEKEAMTKTLGQREQAVIEAAREWYVAAEEEMRWAANQKGVTVNPNLWRLFEAIETLDKAEGKG
jgi:enoyl reductase-like protein